jgi:hypothetical protein
MRSTLQFKSKVWLYPGMAGWHFLSLPKKESAAIKKAYGGLARGWGSLPVEVQVGGSKWKTSIFPDSKTGTYLLPLKSQVRKKEKIEARQTVKVKLEILISDIS